jgi:hypothetical protein
MPSVVELSDGMTMVDLGSGNGFPAQGMSGRAW